MRKGHDGEEWNGEKIPSLGWSPFNFNFFYRTTFRTFLGMVRAWIWYVDYHLQTSTKWQY